MKKFALIGSLLLFLSGLDLMAQVGINTVTPDQSSILEIASSNSGLLIPRLIKGDVANKFSGDTSKIAQALLLFDTEQMRYVYWSKPQGKWIYLNLFEVVKGEGNSYIVTIVKETPSYSLTIDAPDKITLSGNKNTEVSGEVTFADTIRVKGIKGTDPVFGGGLVPIGAILMWSGNPNNLPDGWVLCDGVSRNGLQIPDLRGRFIVGLDQGSSVGYNQVANSGGNNSVMLNEGNLPIHKHSSGTLMAKEGGEHKHEYNGYRAVKDGSGEHVKSREKLSGDPTEYGGELAGKHGHEITGLTAEAGGVFVKDTRVYDTSGESNYLLFEGCVDDPSQEMICQIENLDGTCKKMVVNPDYREDCMNPNYNPNYGQVISGVAAHFEVKAVDARPPYFVLAFIIKYK